jgi:hypothetical protein
VLCDVWLTALEQDYEMFQVYIDRIRLIDGAGDTYLPKLVRASGKEGTAGYTLTFRLTKNAPLKVTASFANVPSSAKDAALLEVNTYVNNSSYIFAVGQLRNLKIK